MSPDQWLERAVSRYCVVAHCFVVTPKGQEVEVLTHWIGLWTADDATGVENGLIFCTEIDGGSYGDLRVWHRTLIGALRYHDDVVAALRAGRRFLDCEND